ncbi:MAG: tetraacyldisaccharide 4'-kinase [Pseudomonadota bacterium]
MPLSWLFFGAVKLRRLLYTRGIIKVRRLSVPVVVVGNISVGGTGKTPLVVWIIEFLRQAGYRPGVISRGYRGKAASWPQPVTAQSDPRLVGDEAVLTVRRAQCPMMVGPQRDEAARALLRQYDCDIIVSDDGLQHYALSRDVEIAVGDGVRRLGNGRLLPAGPLREPVTRLAEVDMVVCNGNPREQEFSMDVAGATAVNLLDSEERSLEAFGSDPVHALAGIGNPERFFQLLARHGIRFDRRIFPDHYVYNEADTHFEDARPVLMTEKDAVKCLPFADQRIWYVPVKARVDQRFGDRLLTLLQETKNGQ